MWSLGSEESLKWRLHLLLHHVRTLPSSSSAPLHTSAAEPWSRGLDRSHDVLSSPSERRINIKWKAVVISVKSNQQGSWDYSLQESSSLLFFRLLFWFCLCPDDVKLLYDEWKKNFWSEKDSLFCLFVVFHLDKNFRLFLSFSDKKVILLWWKLPKNTSCFRKMKPSCSLSSTCRLSDLQDRSADDSSHHSS